jgi:hypothetical protein
LIEYLLLMPLIAAAGCYPLRDRKLIEAIAVAGSLVTFALVAFFSYQVFTNGTMHPWYAAAGIKVNPPK